MSASAVVLRAALAATQLVLVDAMNLLVDTKASPELLSRLQVQYAKNLEVLA